jgi:hypothetical protein
MRFLCCLLAALPLASLATAADSSKPQYRKAFVDTLSAGADFQVQGEYAGQLTDGSKYGVQIVSLGDGKFRAVGYQGGLPGDGWNGSERVITESSADRKAVSGVAEFKSDHGSGIAKGGLLELFDAGGKPAGALPQVHRESPTLGATPPAGAVVLFDGHSADAWRGGRVKDGLLQVGGQSKQSFDDFTLHLEFLLPYMPYARGQDRGNSGLFLQRRYEIQILDSFGLDGADNECGAVYHFQEPLVNMCLPPLSWQTYDMDFKMARFDASGKKMANARVTVKHNGVLIHDQLELTRTSDSPWKVAETADGGPFYIQYHGAPVQFRNIWIVPGAAGKD